MKKYRILIEDIETGDILHDSEYDRIGFDSSRDIPWMYSAGNFEPVGIEQHIMHTKIDGYITIPAEIFSEAKDETNK